MGQRYGGNAFGQPYGGVAGDIANITSGTIKVDDGANATPSYSFKNSTGLGIYQRSNVAITFAVGGIDMADFQGGTFTLPAASTFGWSAGGGASAQDTILSRQAAGRVAVMGATATPAGGSTGIALVFGSTSGFGIYIGSGVPTVSAAQGSLYLRSDGSSTATRAYINTNGSTTWTAVTTAG